MADSIEDILDDIWAKLDGLAVKERQAIILLVRRYGDKRVAALKKALSDSF